jgi:hypothetical protein
LDASVEVKFADFVAATAWASLNLAAAEKTAEAAADKSTVTKAANQLQ